MAGDLEQKLNRRFHEFLSSNGEGPMQAAMHAGIEEVVGRITERGWRGYIVGGMLRDIMLAPSMNALPRDIDLIVVGPSQAALQDAFFDLTVRKTRFGGLHLVRPFEDGIPAKDRSDVLFDLWRLEDTWGLREQGLLPTIENFVKTPFLNIDSAAMELFPANGREKLVEFGFFEALTTRTLDINYSRNPFPLVCIVRSLLMAAKLDFALSHRLAAFVCGYSRWGTFDDLMQAQISHYGQGSCTATELTGWIEQLNVKLGAGANRIAIQVDSTRRKALWEAWPTLFEKNGAESSRSQAARS